MKKLILLLLLIPTISFSQLKYTPKNDYQLHFGAGFVIGGAIGVYHKDPKIALISTVTTGAGVGLLKEVHDMTHGYNFSGRDFLFTTLGGVASGAIIYGIKKQIIKNKDTKKNKKIVF